MVVRCDALAIFNFIDMWSWTTHSFEVSIGQMKRSRTGIESKRNMSENKSKWTNKQKQHEHTRNSSKWIRNLKNEAHLNQRRWSEIANNGRLFTIKINKQTGEQHANEWKIIIMKRKEQEKSLSCLAVRMCYVCMCKCYHVPYCSAHHVKTSESTNVNISRS